MYIKAKNMELPEENFVSMLSALGSVKDAIISGEHLHLHLHLHLRPVIFRGESGREQGGAGALLGGHPD